MNQNGIKLLQLLRQSQKIRNPQTKILF